MKRSKPNQSDDRSKAQKAGVMEKLKSISILAWINLLFILMIITFLLFPEILPPSKREREWHAMLKVASAPLLPLEKIEKITPQLTFAQILHVLPEAEATLNKYGLLCGTCSIAQYETIEMASRVYDFDRGTLISDLNSILQKRKGFIPSEKHGGAQPEIILNQHSSSLKSLAGSWQRTNRIPCSKPQGIIDLNSLFW